MPKTHIDKRDVQLKVENAYQRPDGAIKKTKDTGADKPVMRYVSNWMTQAKPKEKAAKKPAAKPAALPEDLNEMSLKDLKAIATELDIPGRSSMDKKQLVKALS